MALVPSVVGARAVLSAPQRVFNDTVAWFEQELRFRLYSIFPAHGPRHAVLQGYGAFVSIVAVQNEEECPAGALELVCSDESMLGERVAPNGSRVLFVLDHIPTPPPSLTPAVVFSTNASDHWVVGRAGMLYRDLIPDCLGGGIIASHIRIAEGGEVPDYEHYHQVHFQMVYCLKGWVRVVYEDQGEPFVMEPGDFVLQPSEIRHRVLESSAGLEVVEVTSPAEHNTFREHTITLPTAIHNYEREYPGGLFVRHQARCAAEAADPMLTGYRVIESAVRERTKGSASVRVLKSSAECREDALSLRHSGSFYFLFVLEGAVRVCADADERLLSAGESVCIPPRKQFALKVSVQPLSLLEVTLPGDVRLHRA